MFFGHFPLDQLHPEARQAAEAAACADRQGAFWAFHDLVFAAQDSLSAVDLANHAKKLRMDTSKFSTCMAIDGPNQVRTNEASGRALGVTGTPTILIGLVQPDGRVLLKQRLSGAQPLALLAPVLDRWLAEAEKTLK